MPQARLHDGATVEIEVSGTGPAVLVAVDPTPVEGARADELREWGVDPALGRRIVDGLAERFRVLAVPYEAHVLATPKPGTLTPDALARDLLAVADAAGADRFAYYGYSWLALAGLQLAIRTDRLTALAVGGFPPLHGPYEAMLRVTSAGHDLARADTGDVPLSPDATGQFVTLYSALRGFDDRAAHARISCPRLCFAGSADTISYGEKWGGVRVSMAEPLAEHRAELESFGWDVRLLDGLDHTSAMQPDAVLPILRPWLEAQGLPSAR